MCGSEQDFCCESNQAHNPSVVSESVVPLCKNTLPSRFYRFSFAEKRQIVEICKTNSC